MVKAIKILDFSSVVGKVSSSFFLMNLIRWCNTFVDLTWNDPFMKYYRIITEISFYPETSIL